MAGGSCQPQLSALPVLVCKVLLFLTFVQSNNGAVGCVETYGSDAAAWHA